MNTCKIERIQLKNEGEKRHEIIEIFNDIYPEFDFSWMSATR